MGKPTGFIEYPRELPVDRDPLERVGDWEEYYGKYDEEKLQEQGARCMDCGVPFCHNGIEIKNETTGCPIHNLIPEWNDLVYRGHWREALERLLKTNNFPEFTGRICPAPCEYACVLAINEPAVTIKKIESAIADRGFEEGWIKPEPPAQRTGKKIAIVGSGPAGLAAADQLNKAGHSVTVLERDDRIGGLLMYGVPNMKLSKQLVQRRVDLLAAEGVQFRTGAHVGVNVDPQELRMNYDALLLACGALAPIDVPLPGRHLQGVHFAMEFLSSNTKSLLDSGHKDGKYIDARDQDVVVIGAGDTGTDCVATAIRHGCKSLVNFARKPLPPLRRDADNPWPEAPFVYWMDYAHDEGRAMFGRDPREYGILTKAFIDDGAGRVAAVRTVQVEWERRGAGEFANPREIPGTEYDWPADLVLLAVGFRGPEKTLIEQLSLDTDKLSNVKADYGRFNTSLPGVFVAGDMRRGASLIVWAIAEGRGAARAIDRYLMGATELP